MNVELYAQAQTVVKVAAWTFLGGFAAALLALGVWDLYLLIFKGGLHGASASRVIMDYGRAEPVWAFGIALIFGLIVGVLIGHFGWPQWRSR